MVERINLTCPMRMCLYCKGGWLAFDGRGEPCIFCANTHNHPSKQPKSRDGRKFPDNGGFFPLMDLNDMCDKFSPIADDSPKSELIEQLVFKEL